MWALSHVHIFVNTTLCNLNSCWWTPLSPKDFPILSSSCSPGMSTNLWILQIVAPFFSVLNLLNCLSTGWWLFREWWYVFSSRICIDYTHSNHASSPQIAYQQLMIQRRLHVLGLMDTARITRNTSLLLAVQENALKSLKMGPTVPNRQWTYLRPTQQNGSSQEMTTHARLGSAFVEDAQ